MEACAWIHGTCSGKLGPGGWSALIKQANNPTERRLANGASTTTSNRMLLIAAINALEALDQPSHVTIITNSTYLRDGATRWIKSWKSNDWKRKKKRKKGKSENFKPVGNVDLWKQIDALQSIHQVT